MSHLSFEQLRTTIRQHPSRRTARLLAENRQLREAIGVRWPAVTFVGTSPAARALRLEVETTAREADVAVLVMGERGTGRGLVARLIHEATPLAGGPFVAVSCTTLPRALLGPELFGVEERGRKRLGARRVGRFEFADGGTLFLDEVAELPLDLQPRLLAYFRHGAVRRIGSGRRIPVQTRVVTSSSADLRALARRRAFNRELFRRLKARTIRVPPLRERWEDIPAITDWFLARLGRSRGVPPPALDNEARKSLLRYPWPGNVRELQDVLTRASLTCSGDRITCDDLPASVTGTSGEPGPVRLLPGGLALRDIERLAIHQTLAACGGNRSETARRLGLSKKGFYLKMRRLGIDVD